MASSDVDAAEGSAPNPSVAASKITRPSNSLEYGYRWNPTAPGVAESAEDAAWLEAHGYPGPDVELHLMSLTTQSLKALAEKGNQPAKAIYALRLAQSGAPQSEIQEVLLKSAASGSVYALKMAGDIYQTVDGYRDPVMANAYYGLQARLGDQAGLVQNYLIDQTLSQDQRFRAEILKELMWRNLNKTRTQSYVAPIAATSRPGFSVFLEQTLKPTEGDRQP